MIIYRTIEFQINRDGALWGLAKNGERFHFFDPHEMQAIWRTYMRPLKPDLLPIHANSIVFYYGGAR